jgi:hypothetical protein
MTDEQGSTKKQHENAEDTHIEISMTEDIPIATEHVSYCRKYCDSCWDNNDATREAVRLNHKLCSEKCRTDYNICDKKCMECGIDQDKNCHRYCKLNYGEKCDKRCCCVCFGFCNKNWLLMLFSAIGGAGLLAVIIWTYRT